MVKMFQYLSLIMICNDCGKTIKEIFEIKISIINDEKNTSKRLHTIYFCLNCFEIFKKENNIIL